MSVLTVLDPVSGCDGCGACCRELDSPPGYAIVAAAHAPDADPRRLARMTSSSDWSDDVARWQDMPASLRDGLVALYSSCGPAGDVWDGGPCVWWDGGTGRCRNHAWRPSICRDFEVGSAHCRDWRRQYPQVIDDAGHSLGGAGI